MLDSMHICVSDTTTRPLISPRATDNNFESRRTLVKLHRDKRENLTIIIKRVVFVKKVRFVYK